MQLADRQLDRVAVRLCLLLPLRTRACGGAPEMSDHAATYADVAATEGARIVAIFYQVNEASLQFLRDTVAVDARL